MDWSGVSESLLQGATGLTVVVGAVAATVKLTELTARERLRRRIKANTDIMNALPAAPDAAEVREKMRILVTLDITKLYAIEYPDVLGASAWARRRFKWSSWLALYGACVLFGLAWLEGTVLVWWFGVGLVIELLFVVVVFRKLAPDWLNAMQRVSELLDLNPDGTPRDDPSQTPSDPGEPPL